MPTHTVTAQLAASAYLANNIAGYLTHLAYIDDTTGYVVKTGCRVRPYSVLPDSAGYTDERPTCETCGRKWDKTHGSL